MDAATKQLDREADVPRQEKPLANAPLEHRPTPRRLSTVLVDVANERRETVSIGDVDRALRGRSFGPFLIAFSLPNLLPFPPGASTILGLPLVIIAWQLAIGRIEVWLPPFLKRRSISRSRYRRLLARALPRLRKTERMMQPRHWPFAGGSGDRRIGWMALLMALLTVIPVPFANWLPAASCFCLGVALTGRDGIWLSIAVGVGVAAVLVFGVLATFTGLAVGAVAS